MINIQVLLTNNNIFYMFKAPNFNISKPLRNALGPFDTRTYLTNDKVTSEYNRLSRKPKHKLLS